jgi:hypothetical protein
MVGALHNPVHRVGGVMNTVEDDNELFPLCEGVT